jgi:hypothetical protein
MGTIAVKAPKSTVEKRERDDTTKVYHSKAATAAEELEKMLADPAAVSQYDPNAAADRRAAEKGVRAERAEAETLARAAPHNTIQSVYHDDLAMVDARQSVRLPAMIKKELGAAATKEAKRRCYEVEKVMASCLQNKLWTAWKCEKERDRYYKCTDSYEKSADTINDLRWKYYMGTFNGEIVARKRLMTHLWKEYYPDRDMQHEWAADM